MFTVEDPTFRRALRLAAAAGAAALIAALLNLTRTYWAVFAAIVVLNAPPALDLRRALMRIGGTMLSFVLAVGLIQLVGHDSTLAFILALVLLLPGIVLMPINYGSGVVFVTCTVAMIYSSTGEVDDFLKFRVLDNAGGVAVVSAVGLLLLRPSLRDWWRMARLTVGSLAEAFETARPVTLRDQLLTRALQLRTETVDAAALPDAGTSFAAAWTFLAAAEDLIRMLVGAKPLAECERERSGLAARLREISGTCDPDADRTGGDQDGAERPRTIASLDVTRMAIAATVLRRETDAHEDRARC